MTQKWKPTGGRFDVEQLENINEFADLPDLAQLDEAQIYSIRSGDFAPDYAVPWAWDSTESEYQEWRSAVDGQAIVGIPGDIVLKPESNDLDFFTADEGSTDNWSIDSDDPTFGQELSLKQNDTSTIWSGPGDGLQNYPERGDDIDVFGEVGGDHFEFYFFNTSNNDRDSCYRLSISTSFFRFHRVDFDYSGGWEIFFEDDGVSGDLQFNLQIRTDEDGFFDIAVIDIDTGDVVRRNNATDDTYNGQAIGLGSAEAPGMAIADYRVGKFSSFPLTSRDYYFD